MAYTKGKMSSMTPKKGSRCRAKRQLRTHAGVIDAIIPEIDSLGRRLIQVEWDNEICVYVFPQEIETLTTPIRALDTAE
ncbi:MAG TPA: hypothetical protein VEG60_02595 [Candidatus Binatia bacterium]|nr:hypothetical protein [Candidatus Binatia bacterium]